MGILRADRITGLGGAYAIKGSTKFSDNNLLEIHGVESNEDFRLSNGSFTIEFWAYIADTSNSSFVGLFENNPARRSWMFEARANQALRFEWWTDGSSGTALTSSTGAFIRDRWQHFAVVRNGTALNIYVDGTSVVNTTTSDTFYENTVEPLSIGGVFQGGSLTQPITGFISNLRIIKGEAIYTANFTPPTSELTVTSNTVVLACQSPGNVFQEATGKTVVARTTSTNDAPPQASHFTPNSPVGFSTTTDVGSQYGTTFDGFGSFATSTYMVPPGGNTRERNRGRGVYNSGHTPGSGVTNDIEFMEIQSQGNAIFFGDLTSARRFPGASSSATRGVFGSGLSTNIMDFVTIATTANATDFGDMTRHGFSSSGTSDGIRGVYAGGYQQPEASFVNNIDFITFATAGNAQDFGDTSVAACHIAGGSSRTRGVYMGAAVSPSPQISNVIQFVTIQSAGNTTDFGDCTVPRKEAAGASNSTRMIAAGGDAPASNVEVNLIEFITMASAGNATDFGDLTVVRARLGGISNSTRGVFLKGHVLPAGTFYNTADFVNIASTGNAIDFGDTFTGAYECSGCSDSHGGIG